MTRHYRTTEDSRRRKVRGGLIHKWGYKLVEATDLTAEPTTPYSDLLTKLFDETPDEEIEALAASVGATGARRPASE